MPNEKNAENTEDTMHSTLAVSPLPGVIAEDTEVGSLEHLLAAEGLCVESLMRAGGMYTARLKITDEIAHERKLAFAQGSGPTIAAALEDARMGWCSWRDRFLSSR